MIRVTVAGVTGWVGRPLVQAINEVDDLELVGAVARRAAREQLGSIRISSSVDGALQTPSDVFVDYTSAASVRANVLSAIDGGRHVVIGSSGLTQSDFEEIDLAAKTAHVGVVAVGNSRSPQRFCKSSPWKRQSTSMPGRSLIPPTQGRLTHSGMARELAWRLSEVRKLQLEVAVEETRGLMEARGAEVSESRVHLVRLPGYTIDLEVRFGQQDERLTLQYDAGAGAAPYIAGTMLAIRRAPQCHGVVRGLDRLL
jgi:4-hydroxy-tetrahydrodipicolinate reductase